MKTCIIPFAMAASMVLTVASCGKKESPTAASSEPAPAPQAEVSRHEELAIRLMDASEDVFDTVLEVNDVPTAQVASGKIAEISRQLDGVYGELKTLVPASQEVKSLIQEKLKSKDKVMLSKRIEVNQLMQSLPAEASRIIADALQKCSEVMASNQDEFKRHFGVW